MCHLFRMCWLLLIVGVVMLTGCEHNTSQNATSGSMPQLSSSNGPVTLAVNAPLYRASETIIVTLSNQGSEAISFADHHTNCTVFLLQQRINGNWKDIENCYLGRRSIWFTLNAGQHLVVKLAPPKGDWLPGLYHVTLQYRIGQASSSFRTLSSIDFQVKNRESLSANLGVANTLAQRVGIFRTLDSGFVLLTVTKQSRKANNWSQRPPMSYQSRVR